MRKSLTMALLCLAFAFPALADVTFEQETRLGGLMKIATLGRSLVSVTRIAADKMRTDFGKQAQIVDLAAEKIYDVNTGKKTYTVMTFEEMRKRMGAALAAVKASSEKGEKTPAVTSKAEVQVTQTGNSRTIGGYACKQVLLQVDLKMKDEKSKEEATLSGLTDAWLAKDVPGAGEVNAFYQNMAKKLGTTELGQQMMSGGDQSNEFSSAMREMSREMKNMEGFAMRTVFYFGSAEAARAEALKEAKETAPASQQEGGEKKKGGFGGLLGKLGRGGEGEEGQRQQGVGIISKMTLETKRIETGPVDPSIFTIPADYKQIPIEKQK